MMKHLFASLLLIATVSVSSAPVRCQDVVSLHSVTIQPNNSVTVVYSKNFATCAHMRFSNAACTQSGVLTHVNNLFCTQGSTVSVNLPPTAFVAGFGAGSRVFLVHGNNSSVFSSCVTVGCNGAYGAGCSGVSGPPVLAAIDACPPAGGSLDLSIANGPPGSLAVLAFGLLQTSFPLFGCTLLIDALQGTIVVAFDGSGFGTFTLPLPPSSAGVTFTTQAWALDLAGPQGFSATNGFLVRVL